MISAHTSKKQVMPTSASLERKFSDVKTSFLVWTFASTQSGLHLKTEFSPSEGKVFEATFPKVPKLKHL